MGKLQERLSRDDSWSMWVGESTDFKTILKKIEGKFEHLIDGHVAKATEHERRMIQMDEALIETLSKRVGPDADANDPSRLSLARAQAELEKSEQNLLDALDKARDAALLDLTLTEKNNTERKVSGTSSELWDYLEDAQFLYLHISAPSSSLRGYEITVRASVDTGVKLFVRANSDPDWAVAAFTDLSDTIKRSVPKWRWIRNRAVLLSIWFLISFYSLFHVFNTVGDFINPTLDPSLSTWLVLGWIVSAFGVTSAAVLLTVRFLPAFEIVRFGKKPTAKRIGWAIGSPIIALAVGVATNQVSDLVGSGV